MQDQLIELYVAKDEAAGCEDWGRVYELERGIDHVIGTARRNPQGRGRGRGKLNDPQQAACAALVRGNADTEALFNPVKPVRAVIDGNAKSSDGAL